MKKIIVFIINPISGKGKGKEIEPIIQSFFKDTLFDLKIIFAEYAGHAKEIAKTEVSKSPYCIVACGGDGTINEIAQELISTNIPLGIVPIGSGNGLASNLNIPKQIDLALRTIFNNSITTIDVGKINERFFFSNVGLGIDAAVIHRYTDKKQRNFLGYFKAGLWAYVNYKPVKCKVEIDDVKLDSNEFYFLFCSESNEAGYGISFTPDAKLDDGKIDVLCVDKLSFLETIKFSLSIMSKQLNQFDKAVLKQAKKVVFEMDDSSNVAQVDGEAVFIESNRIEVSILSKSLKVFVPKF